MQLGWTLLSHFRSEVPDADRFLGGLGLQKIYIKSIKMDKCEQLQMTELGDMLEGGWNQKYNIKTIYYQVYKQMSRSENKGIISNIDGPLMKVNEVINSIFALNQHEIIDQLQTCSKIVSQLLQNELINHFPSQAATKLLTYELILLIAEENVADSRPRLSLMENTFGNNKKIKLTASMRNTLTSIGEVLEQMIWKNAPKKKGATEKNIMENSALYQGYTEFKQLLADFDQYLEESGDEDNHEVTKKSCKKQEQSSSDESQNQALIQQLQSIVAKKQRRIKELNEQLEQNIVEQKAQQDLISQLECRNYELKQQIKLLNLKLANKDETEIGLHEKIEQLKTQNILQQRELSSKKQTTKTEKTIKTRFTIEDEDEPSTGKKQYKDIFEQKPQVCSQCEARKDFTMEDVNSLRKMLLAQAISIQALI